MTGRRPHVCFVAPNAYPLLSNDPGIEVVGGAELQQVILARGLAERGYPVSMICLDFGQPDRLQVDGITVHRAYKPNAGVPVIRFVWPRLTGMWACLNRVDADIYYQRAASVLTGIMAAHARRHGRRSIFAVAGDPMIRFTRDRRIYEYGIRSVDRVVVQNEAQREEVRRQFGRDSVLIPNSCAPMPGGGAALRTDVLWVSTIRQLKRPDVFLDLAEALPRFRFTMVGGPGDGEAALFEAIRRRAERLPNVEFTGFVPYADADRYFAAARVFVNTSETEGFPNTFLQAWARGVPAVSFVDCGARADGQPVALTVRSAEELTAAVAGLLGDEARRRQLGAVSEEYLRKHHHPGRVLDQYEALFRSFEEEP